jgi:hypothetical protein
MGRGSDRVKDDATYYNELAIGAEYLAAITLNSVERVKHLKMAGTYYRQARLAGSPRGPAILH